MSWSPKEEPKWKILEDLKNFQIVRYIDEILAVSIYTREKDGKCMVSFFNKKNNTIWTISGYQFLDLCLYLATDMYKYKINGNNTVYDATLEIYNICGLIISEKNKPDKIDIIEIRYRENLPEQIHRSWKMYINCLSVFFYSQDNFKPDRDTPYGRRVEMCGIRAMLCTDPPVPPEIACKIFEYDTGIPMGEIPRDKMEMVLKKYDVPHNRCIRNKDGKQKSIDDAWK